jgi:hypothetical protein
MDPDPDPDAHPDPAIFVSDLQDSTNGFLKVVLLITFSLKVPYIYFIFQRLKVIKKSLNSRNQCFSYTILLDDRRIWIRISN